MCVLPRIDSDSAQFLHRSIIMHLKNNPNICIVHNIGIKALNIFSAHTFLKINLNAVYRSWWGDNLSEWKYPLFYFAHSNDLTQR